MPETQETEANWTMCRNVDVRAETLTALAVWDTILLLSTAGYYSLGTIWEFLFGSMPSALLNFTMIFHPLCAASYASSAMLVSALAAQRMFAAQRPLTPRRLSFRKSFTVTAGTNPVKNVPIAPLAI